jgi:hypothetical protein
MTNEAVVRERVEALRARMAANFTDLSEPFYVAVYCNGCTKLVSAVSVEELTPKIDGWWIDPTIFAQDFCSECR